MNLVQQHYELRDKNIRSQQQFRTQI